MAANHKKKAPPPVLTAANVFSPPGDDTPRIAADPAAVMLVEKIIQAKSEFETAVDNFRASVSVEPIEANQKVETVLNADFEIFNMPPPPVAKRGAIKSEKFPFSKLEVGQGFYIRPTNDKPTPWKSFASTVNAAQRRFSKVVGTKERKNKRTGVVKTVNTLAYERKFRLYKVELDGGVIVAAVQRTE